MLFEGGEDVLSFAGVRLGTGDTVSCNRCGPKEPVAFLTTDEVVAEAKRIMAGWDDLGPGPNIGLWGPEPFSHPDLVTIVREIVDAGIERLCVATAGIALKSGQNAEGIMAAGIRHVRVSVLGSSLLHDELQGIPGSYEASLEGMKVTRDASQRAGIPMLVCAHIPVCEHNLRDLPQAVVELAGAGATSIKLEIGDRRIPKDAGAWMDGSVETGIVNNVWVSVHDAEFKELADRAIHYRAPVDLVEVAS
jgi:MoaA/NifB/PqqE/SkfB family radical SAM enzyme